MKSSLWNVSGVMALACLILTGCPSVASKNDSVREGGANSACAVSFLNPKGDFEMSGVVIPLGFKIDAPVIKIGAAKYTASDAQKLSDAAQRMEQARLNNCLVVNAPGFRELTPEMRMELLKDIITVSKNMTGFANLIASSTDPAKAVAEAEKLTKTAEVVKAKADDAAKKIAEVEEKVAFEKPWTSDFESMRAESSRNLATIFEEVKQVQETLASLKNRAQTVKIDIGTFEINATSIPAAGREQLVTNVQQALESIPSRQRAIVLVVGYSDKSGNYLQNLDLGLRRAQAVINYLIHQRFTREYEARAVSGGINDSPGGRSVSIFVAGTEA